MSDYVGVHQRTACLQLATFSYLINEKVKKMDNMRNSTCCCCMQKLIFL
ncbi:conserved hypothetical protein bucentaur or craniofacial development subfamily [Trichinella spiralis]|nr:conserved hypothetical protein bucentaur or craniofacial development subfamily [Trichinella spiralis]